MPSTTPVIIVGAGPVGMVCALALHRRGIETLVLEANPDLIRDQRAGSNQPSTLDMLDSLDVTEEIIPAGLVAPIYHIRDRLTGSVIAAFDLTLLSDEIRYPFVLQYEQYKLTAVLARRYTEESGNPIRFSAEVVALTQTADHVTVQTSNGETFTANYLIGADGGRSFIRKSLDIAFEGFTYPEHFIKVATSFDFGAATPDLAPRTYFSDPEEWCNLFKVRGETDEGMWRQVFPTRPGETIEAALSPAGLETRMQKFFPKTEAYDILNCDIYTVSQRVAGTFRRGRVLLAGDAAHINNPIGGLGLNSGIHDAFNLSEKLAQVLHGADASLLDRYSRQRRKVAVDYVQEQTIRNKKLLDERDLTLRQRNFDELRRIAETPDRARDYLRRAALFQSLAAAADVA